MALFRRTPAPPAITAAASIPGRRSLSRRGHSSYSWQTEIATYARHGPGLVGNYLDFIGDGIEKAGVRFETRDPDGQWTPLDTNTQFEAVCRGVWQALANPRNTAEQTAARWGRLSVSAGEAWLIAIPSLDNGNIERYIAHSDELSGWITASHGGQGSVIWYNPWDGIKRRIVYPSPNLVRLWNPVDNDPQLPQSELQRALPHIREFIDLRRRGSNDARSRLIANDIMSFGQGTEVYEATEDGDPYDGLPQAIVDYLELANAEFSTPYHQRPPVAESVPFPMLGEPPTKIVVGNDLDPSQQQHEDQVVGYIAHALRVPKKLLIEGVGSAKFSNEGYMGNSLIDEALDPVARRVLGDLYSAYFRPVLGKVLGHYEGRTIEGRVGLHNLRIAPNLDLIRPKPDQKETVLQAWKEGLASRRAAESVLGFELLELPADVTDYEFWQQMKKISAGGGATAGALGSGDQGGAITAAAGDQSEHKQSVMIALLPADDQDVSYVSIDLPHLTLVYCGEIGDTPPLSELGRMVEDISSSFDPVEAKVAGVARFGDTANVVLFEHDHLGEMYSRVGFFSGSDHPHFTPHMTLNYGKNLRKVELPETVVFDRVGLFYGEQQYIRPLKNTWVDIQDAPPLPLLASPLNGESLTAILAAADDENELQRAADRDLATQAAIMALALVTFDDAISDIARQATRSIPGRDPLRAELRDLPDHAKYARLVEEGKVVEIDFEELVAISRFQNGVSKELESYARYFRPADSDAGAAAEIAAAAAAIFLALLLKSRSETGSASTYVPDGMATQAMSDTLAVDNMTSPGSYTAGTILGGPVKYKWVHGYYGKPKDPFEIHVARNGNVYDTYDPQLDYPAGGHGGCTCALIAVRG